MVREGGAESRCVGESLAVERARGVDRRTVLGFALDADSVHVLEGESDWVHERVTAGASRVRDVRSEALAGRRPLLVGFVGEHGEVDVARRWRHVLTEEDLAHELATQGGGTAPRMRIEGEQARVRENAGAPAVFSEDPVLPALGTAHRYPVERTQPARHRRLPRAEDVPVVAVLPQQAVDDDPQRLFTRVEDQPLAVGGEEFGILAYQPLLDRVESVGVGEQLAHPGFEPPGAEQSVRLRVEAGVVDEFAPLAGGEQSLVGCAVPEEVGQARRHGEAREALSAALRVDLRLLDPEEEVGRDEHRTERDFEARVELAELARGVARDPDPGRDLGVAERAAQEATAHPAEEARRAVVVDRPARCAADERAAVCGVERLGGDSARDRVVLFEARWRDAHVRGADGEQARHPLVGFEATGGSHVLAEDVGDRRPVLCRGESSHRGRPGLCRRRGGSGPGRSRRRGCGRRRRAETGATGSAVASASGEQEGREQRRAQERLHTALPPHRATKAGTPPSR